MKNNLKEELNKMKYLAGLLSENQFVNEFEGNSSVIPTKQGVYQPTPEELAMKDKPYFKDEETHQNFSSASTREVEELYNSLSREGVPNFKKAYPIWVFKSLFPEYIQKDSSQSWIFSEEGKSMFRNLNAFQRYITSQDESEITPEEFDLDEDMSHNSSEFNQAYKDLAKQIEEFEVRFGLNLHSTTIQDFIAKGKSMQGGHHMSESMLGFKKAFSLDKTYSDVQSVWNSINDVVHKKYPHLKNINGGAGFTNGGNTLKLNFDNFNYGAKTVSINNKTVDFDNATKHVLDLIKQEHLV